MAYSENSPPNRDLFEDEKDWGLRLRTASTPYIQGYEAIKSLTLQVKIKCESQLLKYGRIIPSCPSFCFPFYKRRLLVAYLSMSGNICRVLTHVRVPCRLTAQYLWARLPGGVKEALAIEFIPLCLAHVTC
jgi:hypothetical protein